LRGNGDDHECERCKNRRRFGHVHQFPAIRPLSSQAT
jgi:hypothetical protein